MQAQITKTEGLARELTITVPADVVASRFNTRVEAVAASVKIDGFRPGKVPTGVVKSRLGDQVKADVARSLVEEFLPQALKDNNLNVAGQPAVSKPGSSDENAEKEFVVEEGTDFVFEARVEVYPEFTPKGYEGLELVKETAEADEESIESTLTRLKSQLQNFKPKAGKAAKGDRVTITGQGYTKENGKEDAFEGGKLDNFAIVLGSGQLIPGFESSLEGCKPGDQVDVEVTFPKEYHAPALAGKPAVFKLEVDEVEAPEETEWNEETLAKFGFKTLDELKNVLKQGAERDLTNATQQRLKRQLLDALDSANSFDLPQGLVHAEHTALWRAQIQELQQRGLPIESLGESIEKAIESLKPLAERRVKLGLVLAEIAKAAGITVTAEDVNQAVAEQVRSVHPSQADSVRNYFANPNNRQGLAGPILEDKVTEWLMEKAKVTEKKISAKELLTELQ